MKTVQILVTFLVLFFAGQATAMQGMDHSSTENGKNQNFKHMAMVDGIHAEFQIMDLAAMNMTDPDGKTHHVMATFLKNNEKITKAVGKVKLIAPSGKEQLETFKDYGNGIFAANFNLDEPGKWGVICLFKDDSGKHTVRFWYSHHMM
jgi:hypothetical protein